MVLVNKIKNIVKGFDWKEATINIFFEYSTLFGVILIIYFFSRFEHNNALLVLVLFIIYTRHHHKSEKVTFEEAKFGSYTYAISGKKMFHLLHIPTFAVLLLLLSERVDFYLSLLVFIIWFIATDIYRTRTSIYGHYISRWFGTSKISINNSKWRLYQADEDPFPSVPHMHAISKPLKLDVYNGAMYDSRTNKYVCCASKKDLMKLWSEKRLEFENAREIYRNNNPSFVLMDVPSFLAK